MLRSSQSNVVFEVRISFPHKVTEKGIRLPQVVNQTLHRQTVLFKERTPEHDIQIVLINTGFTHEKGDE